MKAHNESQHTHQKKKIVANVWLFMFCKLCSYASITTIIYHSSNLYTGQRNKEAKLPTKQGDLHRPWTNWNNLKFLFCLIFETEVPQMKIQNPTDTVKQCLKEGQHSGHTYKQKSQTLCFCIRKFYPLSNIKQKKKKTTAS